MAKKRKKRPAQIDLEERENAALDLFAQALGMAASEPDPADIPAPPISVPTPTPTPTLTPESKGGLPLPKNPPTMPVFSRKTDKGGKSVSPQPVITAATPVTTTDKEIRKLREELEDLKGQRRKLLGYRRSEKTGKLVKPKKPKPLTASQQAELARMESQIARKEKILSRLRSLTPAERKARDQKISDWFARQARKDHLEEVAEKAASSLKITGPTVIPEAVEKAPGLPRKLRAAIIDGITHYEYRKAKPDELFELANAIVVRSTNGLLTLEEIPWGAEDVARIIQDYTDQKVPEVIIRDWSASSLPVEEWRKANAEYQGLRVQDLDSDAAKEIRARGTSYNPRTSTIRAGTLEASVHPHTDAILASAENEPPLTVGRPMPTAPLKLNKELKLRFYAAVRDNKDLLKELSPQDLAQELNELFLRTTLDLYGPGESATLDDMARGWEWARAIAKKELGVDIPDDALKMPTEKVKPSVARKLRREIDTLLEQSTSGYGSAEGMSLSTEFGGYTDDPDTLLERLTGMSTEDLRKRGTTGLSKEGIISPALRDEPIVRALTKEWDELSLADALRVKPEHLDQLVDDGVLMRMGKRKVQVGTRLSTQTGKLLPVYKVLPTYSFNIKALMSDDLLEPVEAAIQMGARQAEANLDMLAKEAARAARTQTPTMSAPTMSAPSSTAMQPTVSAGPSAEAILEGGAAGAANPATARMAGTVGNVVVEGTPVQSGMFIPPEALRTKAKSQADKMMHEASQQVRGASSKGWRAAKAAAEARAAATEAAWAARAAKSRAAHAAAAGAERLAAWAAAAEAAGAVGAVGAADAAGSAGAAAADAAAGMLTDAPKLLRKMLRRVPRLGLEAVGLAPLAYGAFEKISGRDYQRQQEMEAREYNRQRELQILARTGQLQNARAEMVLNDLVAKRHALVMKNDPGLGMMLMGLPELTRSEGVIGGRINMEAAKSVHLDDMASDPAVLGTLAALQ